MTDGKRQLAMMELKQVRSLSRLTSFRSGIGCFATVGAMAFIRFAKQLVPRSGIRFLADNDARLSALD